MRISDWSSDVCSSDLLGGVEGDVGSKRRLAHAGAPGEDQQVRMMEAAGLGVDAPELGCDAGKATARVQGLFRPLHGHFRGLRKGLDRSLAAAFLGHPVERAFRRPDLSERIDLLPGVERLLVKD